MDKTERFKHQEVEGIKINLKSAGKQAAGLLFLIHETFNGSIPAECLS